VRKLGSISTADNFTMQSDNFTVPGMTNEARSRLTSLDAGRGNVTVTPQISG